MESGSARANPSALRRSTDAIKYGDAAARQEHGGSHGIDFRMHRNAWTIQLRDSILSAWASVGASLPPSV